MLILGTACHFGVGKNLAIPCPNSVVVVMFMLIGYGISMRLLKCHMIVHPASPANYEYVFLSESGHMV